MTITIKYSTSQNKVIHFSKQNNNKITTKSQQNLNKITKKSQQNLNSFVLLWFCCVLIMLCFIVLNYKTLLIVGIYYKNWPPFSWLQIKMKVTLFNSSMIYNKITTVLFCCVLFRLDVLFLLRFCCVFVVVLLWFCLVFVVVLFWKWITLFWDVLYN